MVYTNHTKSTIACWIDMGEPFIKQVGNNKQNMKYYEIKEAVDTPEVGGIYPQTDGLEGKVTFSSDTSFSVFNHHSFPYEFRNDEKIKVRHSTELTDFISTAIITAHGFIISQKVKEILSRFDLVDSKFYDIQIKYKNLDINSYSWFHMFWKQKYDFVDFESSVFELRRFSNSFGEIKLVSSEDYINKSKENKPNMIRPINMIMKTPQMDLFYSPIGITKIISERLINEFEKNNLTGYVIKELENITIV